MNTISELRKAHRYSYRAMAKLLGIASHTYLKKEHGGWHKFKKLELKELKKLLKIKNIPHDRNPN